MERKNNSQAKFYIFKNKTDKKEILGGKPKKIFIKKYCNQKIFYYKNKSNTKVIHFRH